MNWFIHNSEQKSAQTWISNNEVCTHSVFDSLTDKNQRSFGWVTFPRQYNLTIPEIVLISKSLMLLKSVQKTYIQLAGLFLYFHGNKKCEESISHHALWTKWRPQTPLSSASSTFLFTFVQLTSLMIERLDAKFLKLVCVICLLSHTISL